MTASYRIQSVCECQAVLTAELDDQRQVLQGWCARAGKRELAPASSIGAEHERFDVVWHCAMCGRHSLRTFYAGALQQLPPPAAPASGHDGGDVPEAVILPA